MNRVVLGRLALVAAVAFSMATSGCSTKCGPSNCVGCCSASGICEAASNNTCGLDGAVCTSCLTSEACINGVCNMPFGSLGTSSSTGSPTVAASSGSSGQSVGNSSGTGTPGASSGNTSSGSHGSSSSGATTGVTTGVTDIGTSTGATVGTSSGATVGTTSGTSTGVTDIGTSTGATVGTNTGATTGTTGTSSSGTAGTTTTGSSTGSSGLPLCFSCTSLNQCASGYCNTNTGFCDTAMNCATAGQSCGVYTCGSDGHCACPATNSASTGTSGTSGSISEQGAASCVGTAPVLPLNQAVTGETVGSNGLYVAQANQAVLPDGGEADTCFPAATFPTGDCQGSDSVYVFTPPSSGDYILSAIPDATYDVALVVFEGACQDPIQSCVASIDVQAQGLEESATLSLTGGTPYYVVVTGYYQDGGTDGFDYGSYTLEMATPPTCVTSDLGLTGPGTSAAVSGDTTSASQTYAGGCETIATNSIYYSFTSTAAGAFSATVSTTDASFQPVLSLGTDCGSAYVEQRCSTAATTSTSLDIPSLPAGSYTLVVSGGTTPTVFTGSVGPFTLDTQLSAVIAPPSNNTCSGAKALTLGSQPDGGLSTTLTVSNVGALNTNIGSATGACAGSGRGGSIVYSLDLTSPVTSLTATLIPGVDGGLGNPEISIQESPCYENTDAGTNPSELACQDSDGTPVSVSTTSLQAGTYYIWVGELDTGLPGVGSLQVSVP